MERDGGRDQAKEEGIDEGSDNIRDLASASCTSPPLLRHGNLNNSSPSHETCITLTSLPLDDAEVFTSPSLFFLRNSRSIFHLRYFTGENSHPSRGQKNHYVGDSQVGPVYRTTSAVNRDFLNGPRLLHKNPPCCTTIIAIKWALAALIVSSLFGPSVQTY